MINQIFCIVKPNCKLYLKFRIFFHFFSVQHVFFPFFALFPAAAAYRTVSLRKNYPKYWKVAFGHTQLVRFGSRQDDYVFRYSDLWWPADKSKYEKNMGDVFYYHHRSFALMVQVAVVSQLKLLLSIRDPFAGQPPKA